MAAMDLLGRRWALRILSNCAPAARGPGTAGPYDQMSSSVLYERLENSPPLAC